jgi:hypothetical protein
MGKGQKGGSQPPFLLLPLRQAFLRPHDNKKPLFTYRT